MSVEEPDEHFSFLFSTVEGVWDHVQLSSGLRLLLPVYMHVCVARVILSLLRVKIV